MSNGTNLQQIDQEQAVNLTKFFIRSSQNLFLFGLRGVGKTQIIMQSAEECGYKVHYINLSVIERCDLAGYPDMHAIGDIVNFKSPAFLPKLIGGMRSNSIILFDEVDKAAPETTAPLLELLQFKKINGVPIDVSSCILTGNMPGERAGSNQISSPLLDRGAKFELLFNFDKWIDWAKNNNVNDLILGFLKNNPEFACGAIEDTSYASPSPRGWTQASEALNKAKEFKIMDIDSVSHIISGFVGNVAGMRFRLWYEYYRKFEPYIISLIEQGSMTFEFNNLIPSEKLVFVLGAAYHAKAKTITDKKTKFIYLENLCSFFTNYKVDSEMQVMAMQNSFSFDLITKYKLYTCKKFFELFKNINESVVIKK